MNKTTLKFSILIPAYKKIFFRECIDSILSQTYRNLELIIVDDNSPEDLISVVSSFNDSRIRYYRNENNCGAVNVVDNWNKCLDYATGDYIICMGDDDKLLPHCLEEYNKLIKEYPNYEIYHAWTEIINENSEVIRLQEARPIWESVYSMMWHRWNGRIQYIGDFLFKTSTLRKKGGFYKLPLAWASDDITTYIMAQDTGIINSQIPLFQYRINSFSISSSGSIKIKMKTIDQANDWYTSFLGNQVPTTEGTAITFKKMVQKELANMIVKSKIYTICDDFTSNGFFKTGLYWISNKKSYDLSWGMIAYAAIEALKRKHAMKKNISKSYTNM